MLLKPRLEGTRCRRGHCRVDAPVLHAGATIEASFLRRKASAKREIGSELETESYQSAELQWSDQNTRTCEDERAASGDVDETAEVVVDATRHVLATTATTMGGFLPLILFGGRFWPPMATAIAGGVGGATILALVFVPCVFVWLRRRRLIERTAAREAYLVKREASINA